MYFLVWRDLKVRYKQTSLGVLWAVLQPVATMVVFSAFLGKFAKVPSDGFPYPLFTFCALLPWQLFSFAITESSSSLIQNQALLTKVYFPRLIVPIVPVLTALVDLAIALVVMIGLLIFYRVVPTFTILFLPLLIAFAAVAALAIGIWLAALTAEYRDVRYTIPFLLQFWMFVTPIAYPTSVVPAKWRLIYELNPMTGVVEGFRWAILGAQPSSFLSLLPSVVVVLVLLISGIIYFRRLENTFADVI